MLAKYLSPRVPRSAGLSTLSTGLLGLPRLAAIILFGIAGALILGSLASGVIATPAGDVRVYWAAGERIRDGEPLYAASIPQGAYRYAPWFAWLWAALTSLPRPLVEAGWVTAQLACVAYLLRPLVDRERWPALLILGPALLYAGIAGNVHPALLAGIAYGLPRRSGPLFVALAASLKAFPLLFVLWYVGRGEWRKVAETVALTALLVAPMLLYDLSHFGSEPGLTISLYRASPLLWAAVAALACGAALLVARTRYGVLAAAVAVMASLPRLLFYDLGYLAVTFHARPPR